MWVNYHFKTMYWLRGKQLISRWESREIMAPCINISLTTLMCKYDPFTNGVLMSNMLGITYLVPDWYGCGKMPSSLTYHRDTELSYEMGKCRAIRIVNTLTQFFKKKKKKKKKNWNKIIKYPLPSKWTAGNCIQFPLCFPFDLLMLSLGQTSSVWIALICNSASSIWGYRFSTLG